MSSSIRAAAVEPADVSDAINAVAEEVKVIVTTIICADTFKAVCKAVQGNSRHIKHFDLPETPCWVDKTSGLVAAFKAPSPFEYGDKYALGQLSEDGEKVIWLVEGTDNKGKLTVKPYKGQDESVVAVRLKEIASALTNG